MRVLAFLLGHVLRLYANRATDLTCGFSGVPLPEAICRCRFFAYRLVVLREATGWKRYS
jgi:hypothetical protein